MNLTTVALGLVFVALGYGFVASAKKQPDAHKAGNHRFAGGMMVGAGLIMLGVGAFSYIARQG
ncbi:hypothetical protein H8M03_06195 [Sphingomonas sabuli]|uniref:Uncharacterized protein n=1 Tax=Sphingomonas sabuli TaxID=2764186 RepID=A0A7G9L5J6_9SPHN|nr:hypothetical protein [Sphingomonas sabuli]QNM83895.1 hypothetical protein H8M03_06195 [Sphingomonas sabuli]